MDWIERWKQRLRGLFRRRRFDRELRDELAHHLEMETRRRRREGMEPERARREALRAFGGVESARQQVHQQRWGAGLEALLRDLRHGARSLLRSPAYTSTVVVTLALAIGANVVVFGVVETVLLDPLPYPESERVVRLHTSWVDQADGGSSPAEYLDYRDRLESLAAVGAYYSSSLILQEGERGERMSVAVVTSGVLPALGVVPAAGRPLEAEDGLADDLRLIVSHGFWLQRLGADPGAVGREIRVSGRTGTIVGILPRGFRMPEGLTGSDRVDALVANTFLPENATNRGSHYLTAVGRLRDGVAPAEAAAEMSALVEAFAREHPDAYPSEMGFSVALQPLRDHVVGDVGPALLVAWSAVLFILLVAGANLTSLSLSRAEVREEELALRAALGAGRGRLTGQVLSESLLVCLVGGGAGVFLAAMAMDLLPSVAPPDLPRVDQLGVDPSTMLLGIGLAALVGLAIGLAPFGGRKAGRGEAMLKTTSRTSAGPRARRFRAALVVVQIALTVALLVGAGVLGHSFLALTGVDPGFRSSGVLTARVALPAAGYPEDADRVVFFRQLVNRVERAPGVEAAGAVINLPLAAGIGDLNFQVEGREVADEQVDPAADWQVVVPGYFETMEIDRVSGRLLRASDTANAPGVVVVNESFVRAFFPDEPALGRRFLLGGGTGPGMVTIVGVVEDVTHRGPGVPSRPGIYLAHSQFRFWGSGRAAATLSVVARSSRPVGEVAGIVREAVRELDPGLAVYAVRPMEEVRAAALARPRFLALLIGSFAMVALVLAAVGVYGVVSYSVTLRRREIGIRMALGAAAPEVVRMVLAEGGKLAGLGVVAGSVLALLASPAISGLLYRTSPREPAIFAAVALILGLVAMAGCLLPAARGVRTGVRTLLREQ